MGFSQVLDGYNPDTITKAFKQWMAEKSIMPTPANILEIVKEELRLERERKEAFKAQPAEPLKKGVVQWYGKMWSEFTDSDKSALKRHLATLTESQFDDYVKYLINMIGMPKEALI